MQCLYANGRCSCCGEPLGLTQRRECSQRIAPRPARPPAAGCRHFWGASGETVLVYGCRTCGSARGVPATVGECELHGRCLTFGRGTRVADPTIRRCVECADYART